MKSYLTPKEFCTFPPHIRERLRQTFRIGKSGPLEMVDGQLISDGSTGKDLQLSLNVGAMLEYLGAESGIEVEGLFDRLMEKSLMKMGLLDRPVEVAPDAPVLPAPPESAAPFCDTCDSKGVRHKKTCPKSQA
jgi:hypothetical protein